MNTFMKMLLASFAVMSLVFAGCNSSMEDEATDDAMMEEDEAMLQEETSEEAMMEAEVEAEVMAE